MSKVVGIDLGTTNSVVAVVEGKQPKVIENQEGSKTTPSVVAFTKSDVLVGIMAKRQAITNPERTISSIKRFMGRRYSEVVDEMKSVSYRVVKGPHGDARVQVDDRVYSPPEISAMILRKLKATAEVYLGDTVNKAVITVPAYFNDDQRRATKDAGRIAGLEVLRLLNEPTAAALAYGLNKKKTGKFAVYDFGGGTFDISILEIDGEVFEVRSVNGDTHLGGDDLDMRIVKWLVEEFLEETGIDLMQDPMAVQRLKEAAERAKIELSSMTETEINLPFIAADESGPKHLVKTLTREHFESLVRDLIEKTIEPCRLAMQDAGVSPADIDDVILVGGTTRIPLVQQIVREIFGKEPRRDINPDEAVALGAAIQAAVLAGEVDDVFLLDVTPLSLGVETLGGTMSVVIPRNTTVPVRRTELFTTAADNQTSVEIHVLQGERPLAKDNRSLARFVLDGIPPAPRGVPKIEVTFDIDANGILHVSAKDLATGREQKVTVTASSGLTEDEIKRMIEDAERYAHEDKEKKERIELRNQLDGLVYSLTKLLDESKTKLSAEQIAKMERTLSEAETLLHQKDATSVELRSMLDRVIAASNEIVKSLY